MITQKLISFKCDTDQLELFDSLVEELDTNRNKLLNFLVFFANKQLKNNVFMLNLIMSYDSALKELK